ncbi:hypothetical protein BTW10_16280 [Chromohalobacter japonicus]|uniref:Uncharacterized protein n=1 Tax=Chromohalobacter japonicus TaxID=223900 RepID=A0A1Q8T902_9GAMM|nr:hypothetical protein [Chromohalobacter japonicus]OLO10152.1 hypothetical protein BTW10_16280 [Chromohalobacter japonicus]
MKISNHVFHVVNTPRLEGATGQQLTIGEATAEHLAAGLSLSKPKEREFADKITSLLTSDEVLADFDEYVGDPKPSETENEYVERATDTLRNILMKKLNVKY